MRVLILPCLLLALLALLAFTASQASDKIGGKPIARGGAGSGSGDGGGACRGGSDGGGGALEEEKEEEEGEDDAYQSGEEVDEGEEDEEDDKDTAPEARCYIGQVDEKKRRLYGCVKGCLDPPTSAFGHECKGRNQKGRCGGCPGHGFNRRHTSAGVPYVSCRRCCDRRKVYRPKPTGAAKGGTFAGSPNGPVGGSSMGASREGGGSVGGGGRGGGGRGGGKDAGGGAGRGRGGGGPVGGVLGGDRDPRRMYVDASRARFS
ncbi:hypothetical protein B484DRAFT_411267 [Ochromonadaceae sp. CCMP2298]|nr:hypothetical protein B484DRAFT_411267 [Ochromonadaceae sp. CCMP2298]